jgi:hypothetical protein
MATVNTNKFRVTDVDKAWEALEGLDIAITVDEHDDGTFSLRGRGSDGELNCLSTDYSECIFGDIMKVLPDGEAMVVHFIHEGLTWECCPVDVTIVTNKGIKDFSLNELTKMAAKDMGITGSLLV